MFQNLTASRDHRPETPSVFLQDASKLNHRVTFQGRAAVLVCVLRERRGVFIKTHADE